MLPTSSLEKYVLTSLWLKLTTGRVRPRTKPYKGELIMKKLGLTLSVLLVLVLSACGGGGGGTTPTNQVAGVTIQQSAPGQYRALVTCTPNPCINSSVVWSSSAPNVASVNQSGLVTGIAPGTAIITATSVADPTKWASITVTVTAQPDTTAPTVSITAGATSITTAGSITLTATASDNVGVSRVEFYEGSTLLSEDTSPPYTSEVTLTAANNGTKSYTAKAYDVAGNIGSSGTVSVVVNIPTGGNPITSITIEPSSINLLVGESYQLVARDQNGNDISALVSWTSGATAFVTVNSNGVATAKAAQNGGFTSSARVTAKLATNTTISNYGVVSVDVDRPSTIATPAGLEIKLIPPGESTTIEAGVPYLYFGYDFFRNGIRTYAVYGEVPTVKTKLDCTIGHNYQDSSSTHTWKRCQLILGNAYLTKIGEMTAHPTHQTKPTCTPTAGLGYNNNYQTTQTRVEQGYTIFVLDLTQPLESGFFWKSSGSGDEFITYPASNYTVTGGFDQNCFNQVIL